MKGIADFFEKFSSLKPTSRIIKKTAFAVLTEMNIPVLEEEIVYHNNVIYIKTNTTIKNEIFLSKENVCSKINKSLGLDQVKDIR
ncbi:MAG: hypothetical protein OQJ98_03060 [Candidatus Pacebacteria bacterium]|nr:hypothetical protein [Candidatus Paceibacterota bacterium]